MKKRTVGIGVAATIVLVLIGAVVWWLFETGRLVYTAHPDTAPGKYAVVCDEAIVERYNEVSALAEREGSSVPVVDMAALSTLLDEIKAKPGAENDPTCQTIFFWAAVERDDYKSAKVAYEVIVELRNQRVFADSALRSHQPLPSYLMFLNSLSGAPVREDDQGE